MPNANDISQTSGRDHLPATSGEASQDEPISLQIPSSSIHDSSSRLHVPHALNEQDPSESNNNFPEFHTSLHVPSSPTQRSLGGSTLRSRAGSFNSVVENSVAETSRSRANSWNSRADTARSRANSDVKTLRARFDGDDLTPGEILKSSDEDDEKDFEVSNNCFAFSPGQLNKLRGPKPLAAYKVLGGIRGLEKGLQTDVQAGLSIDEKSVTTKVSFEEATQYVNQKKSAESGLVMRPDGTIPDGKLEGQYHDRIRVFRDNRLPARKSLSLWRLFWNASCDTVLIILNIAAVISLALGIYEAVGQTPAPGQGPSLDWVEGLAIEIAVIIVVLVTGLNDYRREKQFVELNIKKEDRQVKAIRSGKSLVISVFDVVVGDVLHLESGDSVPADGVLISGHGVRCDESSLTGESNAIRKSEGREVWDRIKDGTATPKLDPFIISGSKVLEGVGTYLVSSVGVNSSIGKIMVSIQTKDEKTPLQVKLEHMAKWIGYLGTAASGLLLFILLIRFLAGLSGNTLSPAMKGSQFLDILITAITIIVVAVPEGLPLAVTLALSFATKRLLAENNLVRQLRACETMGNATTICSDKTGTLTQNKMTVVAGITGSKISFARQPDLKDSGSSVPFAAAFSALSPSVKNLLLQSYAINSTAFEGQENGNLTFIGSKTETAILTMAKEHLGMGPIAEERAGVNVVQMIPFDSDRKCMAVVIRLACGSYRLLVKGAAEILLDKATSELANIAEERLTRCELTESARARVSESIERYAQQSLRTIALLYKDFRQWPPLGARALDEDRSMAVFEDVLYDMTLLQVVGIQDPLREGVSKAVARCQDAGIKVRMVTGDNVTTATAIAMECGIKTNEGVVLDGQKFRQLSDQQKEDIIPRLEVLARSSPEDKRILVAKLKDLGETVAVTGDGTNDGPALKTADVGFSMGIAGTEVAKEASAIILMDDNFSSIIGAIMWGRSVNDSVAKFLQFQITVNITAVTLAFVSALASSNGHSVLSAVQLLWVNLIMDTFAALALATDAPTEKILDRKPTPKSAPLITTNMWKMIVGQAAYQLAVTFVLYFAGAAILNYPKDNATLQLELDTMVFNTFVWMQIFNQVNNRRLDNKFNIFERVHRNPFFLAINIIMVASQIMIIFVGGKAFQIKRIDGAQWAICLLCALPCLLWAILLRCIPDKYAATCFAFIARAFSPLPAAWNATSRAVFSPASRFFSRSWSLLRRKDPSPTPVPPPEDEESAVAMGDISPPTTSYGAGTVGQSPETPTVQGSPEALLRPPGIEITSAAV